MVTALAPSIEQRSYVPCVPPSEIADGRYLVRLAQTTEEIEAALKLRFAVFNLELGEGLDSSLETGEDCDEFDATCDHLIVTVKSTREVIGTYRLRTIEMADSIHGFYSAGEFDLSSLPSEVLAQSVELGRACIAQSHRNRQVLFMLWKAMAQYITTRQKRFLFGCCSLTSQEPREGRQVWNQLSKGGHLHDDFFVPPKQGYECVYPEPSGWPLSEVKIPQLFRTYLGLGAKVCSPPAIDRLFKTIDFFVLLDIRQMDAKGRGLFFGPSSELNPIFAGDLP